MPAWTCQQSGACCRAADAVVMTRGELAAVQAVDARPVAIIETGDGRVEVANLHGRGCPYYDHGCQVYPVRPGVCRSFGCFRRPGEAYHDGIMRQRMAQSAGVRRAALDLWDEAEAWTKAHP